MLLMEPEQSPYDLRWSMFGTYVRVHPLFWLFSVILGWSAIHAGLAYLVVWVLCSFVSILLHEFGHVWMGRLFGRQGHIVLYSMGGLAIGIYLDQRWKRILVSFAGPLAQFLLLGGVFALAFVLVFQQVRLRDHGELGKLGSAALDYLFFINLFWPLLNLLPIWPLDGGQIAREFFSWLAPEKGIRFSLGISLLCAGLLAANALVVEMRGTPLIPYLNMGGTYMALLFGILALGSFQALQAEGQNKPPWERWDR